MQIVIATLLQLYLALVRPHLEYASPVWNPSICKQIKMIEDVEKLAIYEGPEGYNPVCAHCIRLYMVCATFLQTLSH